jgi:hypothetical protein
MAAAGFMFLAWNISQELKKQEAFWSEVKIE